MKDFDKIVWSFSKLQTYNECPYAFYLKYIEQREDRDDNFYVFNGSCVHKAFEKYFKGMLKIEDLADFYTDLMLENSHFLGTSEADFCVERCISYLASFQPLDGKFDVLAVEKELKTEIDGYKFIGYADLIIKDKETGNIALVDHKSSGHFLKKNGDVLKSKADIFNEYKKQMYLYAYAIKKVMGLNVTDIVWHHFKDNGVLTKVRYNENDMNNTLKWFNETIDKIRNDTLFECNQTYSRCYKICDFRKTCEYKNISNDTEEVSGDN